MFNGAGLLVSLPGGEADLIGLCGSLAEPHEVLAAPVSPELRAAIQLMWDEVLRLGIKLKCIVRPELFTEGVSQRWLRSQTAEFSEHVCLSDGHAVKPLEGFATHVFFYKLGFRDNYRALQQLNGRAAELLAQVRSQVNTHFVFGSGAQPVPLLLHAAAPPDHLPAALLRFFFNRHSAEDTANRINQAGPINPASLSGFTTLRYMPLSETALASVSFARTVAEEVLRACFDPGTLLVLRLPYGREAAGGLAPRIAALLPALRDSGLIVPRASLANIVFADNDLDEDHPLLDQMPLHMLVHESFDFWRHTTGFYTRASVIEVLAGAGWADCAGPVMPAGFLPFDISSIYGPHAIRRWVGEDAA